MDGAGFDRPLDEKAAKEAARQAFAEYHNVPAAITNPAYVNQVADHLAVAHVLQQPENAGLSRDEQVALAQDAIQERQGFLKKLADKLTFGNNSKNEATWVVDANETAASYLESASIRNQAAAVVEDGGLEQKGYGKAIAAGAFIPVVGAIGAIRTRNNNREYEAAVQEQETQIRSTQAAMEPLEAKIAALQETIERNKIVCEEHGGGYQAPCPAGVSKDNGRER